MNKYTSCILAILFTASPALALEVTNLDKIDHRVLFEAAGTKEVHLIKAGDTEYFAGQTNGILSLLSAENPKPSHGTLHSDGMLSGIIGAERTSSIPADSQDRFAIWPDGTIGIQGHRRQEGGHV